MQQMMTLSQLNVFYICQLLFFCHITVCRNCFAALELIITYIKESDYEPIE